MTFARQNYAKQGEIIGADGVEQAVEMPSTGTPPPPPGARGRGPGARAL